MAGQKLSRINISHSLSIMFLFSLGFLINFYYCIINIFSLGPPFMKKRPPKPRGEKKNQQLNEKKNPFTLTNFIVVRR